MATDGWRDEAECFERDDIDWFPLKPFGRHPRQGPSLAMLAYEDNIRAAVALCMACPVMEECLQDALDHDDEGIRGGTSYEERWQIRHRRAATA